PGADDNASGVAVLLEVARLLGRDAPKTRIDLAAYTLEEEPNFRGPNMGSAVHARSLKQGGVHVRAMISLEMLGYFSDQPGSQSFPAAPLTLFYPTTGNFVAVIGQVGGEGLVRRVKRAMRTGQIPVESMNGPRFIPGIDFSDHASFW